MAHVKGDGPLPADWCIVGEGPGWQEDRDGLPFRGKTGQELTALLAAHPELPNRSQCFLTNIFREYHGKDYVWTAADLAKDEPELLAELARCRPRVIVPLGRYATRFFLGDVDMDEAWGLPWYLPVSEKWPWISDTVVVPIHHPASGFHNPEMSPYVVAGFERWAEYEAGKVEPRRLYNDPLRGKEQYEEIQTIDQLQELVTLLRPGMPLAIDTEGWPDKPWSLQFSPQPGKGYLIKARNQSLIAAFGAALAQIRPQLIFHSALHDLAMMRALGIPYAGKFDDTMVMAYLLQLEPQGLKPLCVRHCNMQMSSYDELTAEPSQRLAVDWLTCLWDMENEDYEETCQAALQAKLAMGRRCKAIPKLPKTPLFKAVTRCLQSKDARKLWGNQIEDIQIEGYRRLGKLPDPTLDYVSPATAISYGCRDADGTARVRAELYGRVQSLGLQSVYELELGTYPLIDRMQHIGIKPDLEHFAHLSAKLEKTICDYQRALGRSTGREDFNANSGDQVAAYLFDELNLQGMKRTSSGRYSTNDKILEALEKEHGHAYPVISDIRAYRETYKLKHTFVDCLPSFTQRWPFDGRIHATFRTTRVVTGRLAASDPNLLAMPKHGQFAADFRRGWIPEPGHLLCEWDLSQIELRVLAHLSQDPVLLGAFRNGQDLHAGLAQRIFGGSLDDHKKGSTRLAAKAINFGIPMGMSKVGLSVELRKNGVQADEDDAQKWLDETMALYAKVPEYQTQKGLEAVQNGYVRFGGPGGERIRYIGGINARDEYTREEAKRLAFSTPIQGGAARLIKEAEVRLYQDILVSYWKDSRWVEPLLQMHDALLLECEDDPELAHDLNDKMQAIMTQAPDWFTVPIETSGEWGTSWADMESFT